MDALSQLPMECLQHILQFIDDSDKVQALAALLLTNKHLYTATLPYLYSDVFKGYNDGFTRGADKTQRQLFTRRLLKRVPVHELPKIVSLSFELDTSKTDASTTDITFLLDYSTCIRHLHIDVENINSNARFPSEPPPQFSPYDQIIHHFSSSYDHIFGEHGRPEMHETIIYYEVCWSVANSISEQLESLTIPLIDARRYLDNIHRFGKLTRVRFNVDYTFQYLFNSNGTHFQLIGDHINNAVQAMIAFVKEHRQMFKDRLKVVSIRDVGKWQSNSRLCPKNIQMEVARAAPPLSRPRYLTKINWNQFAAHPHSTELAYVREIQCRQPVVEWFDDPVDIEEMLRRCRSLQTLDVASLGRDGLKWAVQYRKSQNGQDPSSSHQVQPTPLPPLATVTINSCGTVEEINDVAFAFNQTLKSLAIRCSTRATFSQTPPPFGHGWVDLPLLTYINFEGYWKQVIIDQDFFIHCPNIKGLQIVDNTTQYLLQDIGPPCRPAQLARVKMLHLRGWAALTFHPDTLHSAKSLYSLQLRMDMEGGSMTFFIPPVEDLDLHHGKRRDTHLDEQQGEEEMESGVDEEGAIGGVPSRPLWTWDWYLPSLESVVLTSEFAYRFEFKMLMGCPSLKLLELDMRSRDDNHTRVITEADFFMQPATTLKDEESDIDRSSKTAAAAGMRRIVASSVETLRLAGPWHITDTLLLPFLTGTFPNLMTWIEQSWKGYTLPGLIDAIRTGDHTWIDVHVELPEPSREEMVEFGLCTAKLRNMMKESASGGEGGGVWGGVVHTSLFFSRELVEYEVLRVVDLGRRVEDVREESVEYDTSIGEGTDFSL
ncbi:hypothetical protein BKA57DRAFT_470622 [Linnemannia elongata]|nr:hypothetical protein BKA57DRAFT_470622 [Linnemannia elongata]